MALEEEIEAPSEPEMMQTSIGITLGPPVPKHKRLELLDPDTWEEIALELVHHHWKRLFHKVVKCGGAGDMGRDVIAYNEDGSWVNYQCKYYGKKLPLRDALLEIGKLVYYSLKGEYTIPKEYYFIAPKGASLSLIQHLMDTDKLKEELLARWDGICKKNITRKEDIPLDDGLQKYIKDIDFNIFDHIPPLDIIDLHSTTPHHAMRFGDDRKERPVPPTPPQSPTSEEFGYTSELLKAFSDKENQSIDAENLPNFSQYRREYESARKNYYCAEGLEKFSRDWLTDKTFKDLLDECYEVISPVVLIDHPNGFDRYLKASGQAAMSNFAQHPLHHYIQVKDKKGMCHHLANEGTVKWVKEET